MKGAKACKCRSMVLVDLAEAYRQAIIARMVVKAHSPRVWPRLWPEPVSGADFGMLIASLTEDYFPFREGAKKVQAPFRKGNHGARSTKPAGLLTNDRRGSTRLDKTRDKEDRDDIKN